MTTQNPPAPPTESTSEKLLRILTDAKGFIGSYPDASTLEDLLDTASAVGALRTEIQALHAVCTGSSTEVATIKASVESLETEVAAVKTLATNNQLDIRRAVALILTLLPPPEEEDDDSESQ